MTDNIIHAESIFRARQLFARVSRESLPDTSGFTYSDRVRHKTYNWEGTIEAFDFCGDKATHAYVSSPVFERLSKPIRVPLNEIEYLYSAEGVA